MKIENEVQLMQLQMMTRTLKQTSGDSKSFYRILNSMLNAMSEQDLAGLNPSLLVNLLRELNPKTKRHLLPKPTTPATLPFRKPSQRLLPNMVSIKILLWPLSGRNLLLTPPPYLRPEQWA